MSDVYGPLQIPLTASVPIGTDPLTYFCLSFFQTIANAYAIHEWQNVAPGATTVIASAYDHNPVEDGFNQAWVPALFLYRKGTQRRADIGADYRVEFGELELLYIPPKAVGPMRRQRAKFAAKLFKTLDDYFERSRDPAWVVTGDPDETAAQSMAPVVETGTSPAMTVTGTPIALGYSLKVIITTGGARGTAAFKWSIDGGVTYTLGVLTAATVVLGASGLTLAFATGTYVLNDSYIAVAQGQGSMLATFAGFHRMRLMQMVPSMFTVETDVGGDPLKVFGYKCTITVEEKLTRDPATQGTTQMGADETVQLPADPDDSLPDPLVVGQGALETPVAT